MSPQLEAILIATLGTISASCAIIAWAFHRLAQGGDRWTHAANTLSNRLTALEETVDALLGPIGVANRGEQPGIVERRSVAPVPSEGLWISSREQQ